MGVRSKLRAGVVRVMAGALLASTLIVVAPVGPADAAENPPPFILSWDGSGSGNGHLGTPQGIAVDGDGNVYVVDPLYDRVSKFTSTGTFITGWGSFGSGNGEFIRPVGVAVDDAGSVYVADTGNHRIQKFTSTGTFVAKWGRRGSARGRFRYPLDLAIDEGGNVYVTDSGNHRVQTFTSTGAFIDEWGSRGTGNGQFDGPDGVAVDSDGNVYVADGGNYRVQKFTSTGTFVAKWGSRGSGNGQFGAGRAGGPQGLAVDVDGNVYVTDTNDRIEKFTSTGEFLTKWGTPGTGDGQFTAATDVAVDDDGNVYVADTGNSRVQKFGLVPRPDGRIRRQATGTYVGNDIYNTTGRSQTITGSAAPGGSVRYWVSAQNDAPIPDTLRLKGTISTAGYAVRYIVDGLDITPQVTAGTYTTPTLAPGATHLVKVVVTVTDAASAGSSLNATMIVTSNTAPATKDKVRFVTSRA